MKLTFAFSPCPNDTFMFEPIVSKRIDTEGLSFEFQLADVEELNKSAIKGTYDITKLSFNAFTKLTSTYQLLNAGSALGRNCGPLLIAKKPIEESDINTAKIAIPGENTTANFLLSFAYPKIRNKQFALFSDIEALVLEEKVDAGVIIHENRFTFQEKGLVKICDLGEAWEQKTGYPIPLGGIVTRRSFDDNLKQKIDRVIARSVKYALTHPSSGMSYIRRHAQEMDDKVMQAHIELYVNSYSRDIGKEGKASVQYLFENHPNSADNQYVTPLFISYPNEVESSQFLTESYWSSKYLDHNTGWDVGTITRPIKEYVNQIKDKSIRILIPGAGNGHEAEYLHRLGFENVVVCDFAKEALDNLSSRCPSFPKENLILSDFFELQGCFDLILEQTFFCALSPNLRKKYSKKMSELLAKKGQLVGLLFNIDFPFDGPPFGGSISEYQEILAADLKIVSMAVCTNSIPERLGNELFFVSEKK